MVKRFVVRPLVVFMERLAAVVRFVVRPLVVERFAIFVGYGLVVAGVWMVYHPAGFVIAGVLLLVAALWRSKP
jgi:hypothetical protein